MQLSISKYLIACLASTLFTIVLGMGFTSRAQAVDSGLLSAVYPNTSGNNQTTYTGTELCSTNTTRCMKGQRTFTEVYVPVALTGRNVTFTILDACDGSDIDNSGVSSFGYTADTQYRIVGSSSVVKSTDTPGGNPTCLNLDYTFTASSSLGTLSENEDYRVFTLFAEALPKVRDGNSYYRNLYRLSSSTPTSTSGILFGITPRAWACPVSTYKYSCPTPYAAEGGQSFSFSAFFQPGTGPYSQKIVLRTGCTDSYKGGILIYDLDSGNYSQTNIRAKVTSLNPDGTTTVRPSAAGLALSSSLFSGKNGNDEYLKIDNNFEFLPNTTYVFEIWNLNQQNTLQILPYMRQSGVATNCGSPPVGTLELTCDASGNVTIGARANDADSQIVRLTGEIPEGKTRNGTAVPITAGSVKTVAGGAEEPFTNIAPASFSGIRDGASHSVTLTLKDSLDLTASISDSYTCQRPVSAFFDMTCANALGVNAELGEPYYPRVNYSRTGSSTETYEVTMTMAVVGNSAKRDGTYSSTKSEDVAFVDSGDPSPLTATRSNFDGVNNGVIFSSPGNYRVTYTGSFDPATAGASTINDTCEVTVSVRSKPYFKVVGGDIWASGNDAKVAGFNKNGLTFRGTGAVQDNSGKSGAGAQGLVMADYIDGVSSGVFLSLSPLIKPLTFSNTGTQIYGGDFGDTPFVMPTVDVTAVAYNSATSTNGSFIYTGDLTYSDTSVDAGTHLTIYIRGNLTIDNNILYSNSGSYADVASIPHVKLVVLKNAGAGGNVYINPGVSQIDAEIIAEGDIDTCYTTRANKFTDCGDKRLIVNGSLIGSRVLLNRLAGTLRDSRATDGKFASCEAPTAITNGLCNSSNIAEIILHTPESYLSSPGERPEVPDSNRYDSITALPPLF